MGFNTRASARVILPLVGANYPQSSGKDYKRHLNFSESGFYDPYS